MAETRRVVATTFAYHRHISRTAKRTLASCGLHSRDAEYVLNAVTVQTRCSSFELSTHTHTERRHATEKVNE